MPQICRKIYRQSRALINIWARPSQEIYLHRSIQFGQYESILPKQKKLQQMPLGKVKKTLNLIKNATQQLNRVRKDLLCFVIKKTKQKHVISNASISFCKKTNANCK